MAKIIYEVYQNQNEHNAAYGKWYGRVKYLESRLKKEEEAEGGSGNSQGQSDSQSGQQGEQGQQGGSSTGSEAVQGYALTISKTGSGTATVSSGGNAVNSGASLSEDAEVELSITPAEGQVPTATINGSQIELTEDGGVYTGSFAMPAQASTLVINTGTVSGGDGDDQVDQD